MRRCVSIFCDLSFSISWLLTCLIESHINIRGCVMPPQTARGICLVLLVTRVVLRGALVSSQSSIPLQNEFMFWEFFLLVTDKTVCCSNPFRAPKWQDLSYHLKTEYHSSAKPNFPYNPRGEGTQSELCALGLEVRGDEFPSRNFAWVTFKVHFESITMLRSVLSSCLL